MGEAQLPRRILKVWGSTLLAFCCSFNSPDWQHKRMHTHPQEIQRLMQDPAPGIQAHPSNDNLRYFNVTIEGPADSPYEGGVFKLELFLPEDYPMAAPKARLGEEKEWVNGECLGGKPHCVPPCVLLHTVCTPTHYLLLYTMHRCVSLPRSTTPMWTSSVGFALTFSKTNGAQPCRSAQYLSGR